MRILYEKLYLKQKDNIIQMKAVSIDLDLDSTDKILAQARKQSKAIKQNREEEKQRKDSKTGSEGTSKSTIGQKIVRFRKLTDDGRTRDEVFDEKEYKFQDMKGQAFDFNKASAKSKQTTTETYSVPYIENEFAITKYLKHDRKTDISEYSQKALHRKPVFLAESVKNFAIYQGTMSNFAKNSTWKRVDLLLVSPLKRGTVPWATGLMGSHLKLQNSFMYKCFSDLRPHDKQMQKEMQQTFKYNVKGRNMRTNLVATVDLSHFMFIKGKKRLITKAAAQFKRGAIQFVGVLNEIHVYRGMMFSSIALAVEKYDKQIVVDLLIQIYNEFPDQILYIEGGCMIFEYVRDIINGVLLKNVTIRPTECSPYLRVGDELENFESYAKTLNKEIALRDDFIVLAAEVCPTKPPPVLVSNFVKWCRNFSFIPWMTPDPSITSVKRVKPLSLQLVKGGVLGLISRADVQELHGLRGKVQKKFLPFTQEEVGMMDEDDWERSLRKLNLPEHLYESLNQISEVKTVDIIKSNDRMFYVPVDNKKKLKKTRNKTKDRKELKINHLQREEKKDVEEKKEVKKSVVRRGNVKDLLALFSGNADVMKTRLARYDPEIKAQKEQAKAQRKRRGKYGSISVSMSRSSIASRYSTADSVYVATKSVAKDGVVELDVFSNKDAKRKNSASARRNSFAQADISLLNQIDDEYTYDFEGLEQFYSQHELRLCNQTQFELDHLRNVESLILRKLKFMKAKQLLKRLQDLIKQEEVSDDWANNTMNKVVTVPDPAYLAVIQSMQEIVNKTSENNKKFILPLFKDEKIDVLDSIQELIKRMENHSIHVWSCDKMSFKFESVSGQPDRMLCLYEEDEEAKEMDFYISKEHPSMVEAIMYLWFRYKGFTAYQCMLLECLHPAQQNEVLEHGVPYPTRFEDQIYFSSTSDLTTQILLSKEFFAYVAQDDEDLGHGLTKQQVMFLVKIINVYTILCKKTLIDDVANKNSSLIRVGGLVDTVFAPHSLEGQMVAFVRQALLTTTKLERFADLIGRLLSFFRELDKNPPSEENEPLFVFAYYTYDVIFDALRSVGLEELEILLLLKNPVLLPEPDQATVATEMICTPSQMDFLYGLASGELGTLLYKRIRGKVLKYQPTPNQLFINNARGAGGEEAGTDSKFEKFVKQTKYISAGMFFCFPAFVEIILTTITGSGVFSSSTMPKGVIKVITLLFFILFPILGGAMGMIGKVTSYYYFQISIPVMLIGSLRLITLGLILTLIVAFGCGLFIFFTMKSLYLAVFGMIYGVILSMYLTFMSALFSMRGEEFILKATGPRAIFQSLGILSIPSILLKIANALDLTGLTPDTYKLGVPPVIVYTFALFVAALWLIRGFKNNAKEFETWRDQIDVTKDSEVMKLFETVCFRPRALDEEEILSSYQKRGKRWERLAREYFMAEVEKGLLLKDKQRAALPQIVKDRLKQSEKEMKLMNWYLILKGHKVPPRFSFEWDVLLKLALSGIQKKFAVEELNRGGLLYDFTIRSFVYMILYFVTIFIDRWASVVSGNGLFLFKPSDDTLGNSYGFGIGWATIFMLISASTLELDLLRISEAEQNWETRRLKTDVKNVQLSKQDLFTIRVTERARFYKKEFKTFLKVTLGIFVIISSLVLWQTFQPKADGHTGGQKLADDIAIFFVGSFGYLGILVGLFHKLFLPSFEKNVNVKLLYCNTLGILVAGFLVSYMKNRAWVCMALPVTGWTFAISLMFEQSKQLRNQDMHAFYAISPHLMSSGQKLLGSRALIDKKITREEVIRQIKKTANAMIPINPQSVTGNKILNIIATSKKEYKKLSPILRMTFEGSVSALEQVEVWYKRGKVKVYLVPRELLVGKHGGYIALSKRTAEKGGLEVFVGVKEPQEFANSIDKKKEGLCYVIAEALLHETAETLLGFSHTEASVFELVLLKPGKTALLPNRINMQMSKGIHQQSTDRLLSTEFFYKKISKRACFDVDVDRTWRRLGTAGRRFLIAQLEDFLEEGRILAEKSGSEHDMKKIVSRYDKMDIDVQRDLARSVGSRKGKEVSKSTVRVLNQHFKNQVVRSHVASYMAMKINKKYSSMYKKKRGLRKDHSIYVQKKTESELKTQNLGKWKRFSFSCRAYVRILFMAMSADPRFGREVFSAKQIYGKWFSIWPRYLSFFYIGARKLSFEMTRRFLFACRPVITTFQKNAKQGLYRKYYYNADGELKCVRLFDSIHCGSIACYIRRGITAYPNVSYEVFHYEDKDGGTLSKHNEPDTKPVAKSIYIRGVNETHYKLTSEIIYNGGKPQFTSFYEYEKDTKERIPLKKITYKGEVAKRKRRGGNIQRVQYYDREKDGRVKEVELMRGKEMVVAKYFYVQDDDDETAVAVSHVEYTLDDHKDGWTITIHFESAMSPAVIAGSTVPRFKYVDYVARRRSRKVVRSFFNYTHSLHYYLTSFEFDAKDDIETSLAEAENKLDPIETPSIVQKDSYQLLFARLPSPFHKADVLWGFGQNQNNSIERGKRWCRCLRKTSAKFKVKKAHTSRTRWELWRLWRSGKINGVYASAIDEYLLRNEPALQGYWKARDRGDREAARKALDSNPAVVASILVEKDDKTNRSHFRIRIGDLRCLGMGGDSEDRNINDKYKVSAAKENLLEHEEKKKVRVEDLMLEVLSLDSGTWPIGGGGVGGCRSQVVNHIKTIRWSTVSEIGSDSQMMDRSYQVQKNVDSVKFVRLWSNDFGSPNQYVYNDSTYNYIEIKTLLTTPKIIKEEFYPICKAFIEACGTESFSLGDPMVYLDIFVKMYYYFQNYDWVKTWESPVIRSCWTSGWINQIFKKSTRTKMAKVELPTLDELESLFHLISRLLFPICATIPKRPVVHASHHGIQALLGAVSKMVWGSSFIVWDHGILWRERLNALCGRDVDTMPRFVQWGFIGFTRIAAFINYNMADIVCPCTSISNVYWEEWIGGAKYHDSTLAKQMRNKVSVVLNGMDVNRFVVKRHLESPAPTVVMLSHVNAIKDVMNAIKAAAHIVHDFKITEYQLLVYGSLTSDAVYANECQLAVVALNLSNNVRLMGLGNPTLVLPKGWLFLNSSASEGLPLAIGEAGLTGLPVVCTDVGGSREVVSSNEGVTFGQVVPPRSPYRLAISILEVLGMLNGRENIVDPKAEVKLVEDFSPEELTARMKSESIKLKRRNLGLRLRSNTYYKFPITRYIREHEQQMWLASTFVRSEEFDLTIKAMIKSVVDQ